VGGATVVVVVDVLDVDVVLDVDELVDDVDVLVVVVVVGDTVSNDTVAADV
jgi:hypothetical protein